MSNSDNKNFIGTNSLHIEELGSDYSSSKDLYEESSSKFNNYDENVFQFNSNNNNNNNNSFDVSRNDINDIVYSNSNKENLKYKLVKQNSERNNRQGRLLLVSLLENFCAMYDQSPQTNQQLFYVICKQLSKMGIIEEEDFMEELASVRSTYKKAFKQLIIQALMAIREENMYNSRSLLMPPSVDDLKSSTSDNNMENFQSNSYGSSIPNFKTFEENMKSNNILDFLDFGRSRYLDDFIQIRRLGKGAFGAVFEAENKLDGLRYAVKIIRIPSLKDLFIDKIINEVKFLARLDHKNVIRYYSAWLDNDSPVFFISDDDDSEFESEEDEDEIFETNNMNNNIKFINDPFFIRNQAYPQVPFDPSSYSSRGIYIEELDSDISLSSSKLFDKRSVYSTSNRSTLNPQPSYQSSHSFNSRYSRSYNRTSNLGSYNSNNFRFYDDDNKNISKTVMDNNLNKHNQINTIIKDSVNNDLSKNKNSKSCFDDNEKNKNKSNLKFNQKIYESETETNTDISLEIEFEKNSSNDDIESSLDSDMETNSDLNTNSNTNTTSESETETESETESESDNESKFQLRPKAVSNHNVNEAEIETTNSTHMETDETSISIEFQKTEESSTSSLSDPESVTHSFYVNPKDINDCEENSSQSEEADYDNNLEDMEDDDFFNNSSFLSPYHINNSFKSNSNILNNNKARSNNKTQENIMLELKTVSDFNIKMTKNKNLTAKDIQYNVHSEETRSVRKFEKKFGVNGKEYEIKIDKVVDNNSSLNAYYNSKINVKSRHNNFDGSLKANYTHKINKQNLNLSDIHSSKDSLKNNLYDNELIFMMENEVSQDDAFLMKDSSNKKLNTKLEQEQNRNIGFTLTKTSKEEEDNDITLNSKPINSNKTFDSVKYKDNLSRSIPININRKKWRDTKYSNSYIDRTNIKMKESKDSLSSSYPEYVSSSISFSKQIEMMDLSNLSKLSKENTINSSLPNNSVFSESNQNIPSNSFISKSSKKASLYSKATSNHSKIQNSNNKIILNTKPKINKKKKEKAASQSDIILCIQMQLCQVTLHDYLQDRNKLLNESSNLVDEKGYPLIDEEENYHIWCDVIEGVKYIHSKGLIHRDIKPNNIFWVPNDPNVSPKLKLKLKEGVWKLGDFGLMTSDMQNELGKFSSTNNSNNNNDNHNKNNKNENKSNYTSIGSQNISNLASNSNSDEQNCTKLANYLPQSSHTIGIGTVSYGSPEQLDVNNTNPYNYTIQSDIYPLGIILFELYFPFSTAMERAKAFYDLREKQILPEKFVKRFPQEAAIVLWLTQKDPEKRPTVNELYNWNVSTIIKSKFSKQFTTKVSSSTIDDITKGDILNGGIIISKEIENNQQIHSNINFSENMLLLSNFLELSMKDKIIKSKEEENIALKKQIENIKAKEEENLALKKRIQELELQLSNKNENK